MKQTKKWALVGLKTKQCNRINVDYDMRLKLSSLERDLVSLMSQHKQHLSSHCNRDTVNE